jgi:hypothetical protein
MKTIQRIVLSACFFAILPIFASAQSAPTISYISPDSGGVGSQATIHGSNLYGNVLVINGEIAQSWQYNSTLDSTGNTMTFGMPSRMGSNTIQVEQRIVGGRSNAATVTVVPSILSITPSTAKAGDVITVYGTSLYGNMIVFDGNTLSTSMTNYGNETTNGDSVTFTVPLTASVGNHSIQVEQRIVGGRSNQITLNVISSSNFNDAYGSTYSKTSNIPISSTEKVITYTYPNSPCGTLMTNFTSAGSVSVGNGPVYDLAVQVSPAGQMPDISTFRTYSCNNISVNGNVLGKATFAFKLKSNDANQNAASNNLPVIPYSGTPISQLTQSQKNEMITQIRATLTMLIQQLTLMLQQGKL